MPSPQPAAGDHYFAASPAGDPAERTVELVLPEGRLIPLTVARGVFAADGVDAGTRVLLAEGPPVAHDGTVVDLGCGYGPIALTLALRSPGVTVWAVDVNERARDLCRRNAAANGVGDRVRVVDPSEVPDDLVVDQIWSNPPIRVGKAVLHGLLTTWLDRLAPTHGTGQLVVHKHLGADSLQRWLSAQGWASERTMSRAGYRILCVQARPRSSEAAPEVDDA